MGDPGIIPPSRASGSFGMGTGSAGGPASAATGQGLVRPQRQGSHAAPPSVQGFETQSLNPIQLNARVWFQWECDRPTILLPVVSTVTAVQGGARLAGSQFPIYYVPNTQPALGTGATMATPEDAMQLAQVSKGCGIVYLPKRGRWNLYWDAANAASRCNLLIIDASDPAVAARYLFEAGVHGVSVNTQVTVGVGSATILASNRLRKGFLISVTSAIANAARLGFNAAAVANSGAKIGTANQPSAFSMSGENCFMGDVTGIRDLTAVADVDLAVTEWF
jgi:hypothetical protein